MAMNAVDLTAAAGGNDTRGVRRALRKGVDVNARGPYANSTALHHAARMGAREALSVLLKAGADPNLQDARGNTALFEAVSSTKAGPDIVRALIAAGADPDIKNAYDTSPTDYVIRADGMDVSIFGPTA